MSEKWIAVPKALLDDKAALEGFIAANFDRSHPVRVQRMSDLPPPWPAPPETTIVIGEGLDDDE